MTKVQSGFMQPGTAKVSREAGNIWGFPDPKCLQLANLSINEYDSRMNFARTILACLIILMMSMSSWANTSMTGMSIDPVASTLAASDMAVADHDHHAADLQDIEQDGSDFSGDDSAPVNSSHNPMDDHNMDCPCCGGCMSLCAVSGSGSAAITGSVFEFVYPQAEAYVSVSTSFQASPPSPPLFRPPSIQTL